MLNFNQTFVLLFVILLMHGCSGEFCESFSNEENGPNDIIIKVNDSTNRIRSLYYPQVNKYIVASKSSMRVSGTLLRGFDQTEIVIHFDSGGTAGVVFSYQKEPVHSQCDGWEMRIRNIQMVAGSFKDFRMEGTYTLTILKR